MSVSVILLLLWVFFRVPNALLTYYWIFLEYLHNVLRGRSFSPDVVTRVKQSVVSDVTRGVLETQSYASPLVEVPTFSG